MPLIRGFSKKSIQANTQALKNEGKKPFDAHAGALSQARKARAANPQKPITRLPKGKPTQ